MTGEDEEFNRIEQEADMRRKAVRAALKEHNEHMLQHMSEYERGFIHGMQKQAQSSVDKVVNAMVTKKPWQGLTDEERDAMIGVTDLSGTYYYDDLYAVILLAEGKLKEKNAM